MYINDIEFNSEIPMVFLWPGKCQILMAIVCAADTQSKDG